MLPVDLPAIPPVARETLRLLLRGEAGGRNWPAEATGAEGENFVEALAIHGMAPLVFQRATDSCSPWPVPVMEALRSLSVQAAAEEPLRQRDLADLLVRLHQTSIEVLIIKGSALAYQLYDQPEWRPRADTDLLIRTVDVRDAIALLESMGYVGRLLSGDPLANRQQAFARVDRFGLEHVYDLHWDITNTPVVRGALSFEELLRRSVAASPLAPLALAPSLPDALLLACIHRAAHHHDSERLIWLYDIFLLHDRLPAEGRVAFRREAEERGVSAICAQSLRLAEEWFGSVSPSTLHWVEEAARRGEVSAKFLNRQRRHASVLVEDLRALPWAERLRRLRDLALPPAPFLRARYPSAPRMALPLLYLLRGAGGVMRLFRRVHSSGTAG